jgi:hypothetical protein
MMQFPFRSRTPYWVNGALLEANFVAFFWDSSHMSLK